MICFVRAVADKLLAGTLRLMRKRSYLNLVRNRLLHLSNHRSCYRPFGCGPVRSVGDTRRPRIIRRAVECRIEVGGTLKELSSVSGYKVAFADVQTHIIVLVDDGLWRLGCAVGPLIRHIDVGTLPHIGRVSIHLAGGLSRYYGELFGALKLG